MLNATSPSQSSDIKCQVAPLVYRADALICLDRAPQAIALLDKATEAMASGGVKRGRDGDKIEGRDDQRRRKWTRARVLIANNRALSLLCVGREKEALLALRELALGQLDPSISENMREQIHFNYTLVLWRSGQRTAASAHWLSVRGFIVGVPSVRNDCRTSFEISPDRDRGSYRRIEFLLRRQRDSLRLEQSRIKSQADSERAQLEAHVSPAAVSLTRGRGFGTLENRVPLIQVLGLDVMVLARWLAILEDHELSDGLICVEKMLACQTGLNVRF